MFFRPVSLPVLIALAIAPSARVLAQSSELITLQLSAIHAGVSGDGYERLTRGVGFEGQVRYTPKAWSIGVGFQSTSHPLADRKDGDPAVVIRGGFIEPRYEIGERSNNRVPYVAMRMGFLEQAIAFTVPGAVTYSASGTQINAGGGMLMRLSSRIRFDIGASIGLIQFGDSVGDDRSMTAFDGTTGSGMNLMARLGLVIGLGSMKVED